MVKTGENSAMKNKFANGELNSIRFPEIPLTLVYFIKWHKPIEMRNKAVERRCNERKTKPKHNGQPLHIGTKFMGKFS